MLKLRELIKKVRSCKTAEEERSVINKESAEIRNMGKVKKFFNEIGAIRPIQKQKLSKMYFHAFIGIPNGFHSNDLCKFIS